MIYAFGIFGDYGVDHIEGYTYYTLKSKESLEIIKSTLLTHCVNKRAKPNSFFDNDSKAHSEIMESIKNSTSINELEEIEISNGDYISISECELITLKD